MTASDCTQADIDNCHLMHAAYPTYFTGNTVDMGTGGCGCELAGR